MSSIISTELLKHETIPNVKKFYMPIDLTYDYILLVESANDNPVISIDIEVNGNCIDTYTLANWPSLAPKRIDKNLIYKLDFWFSDKSTPFHYTYALPLHSFILVTLTNDYPVSITTTNNIITYLAYTHAEIKVSANYTSSVQLRYVIGTFTIYCIDGIDKIHSIVTSQYTYHIDPNKKTKHITLSVFEPIVTNAATPDQQQISKYINEYDVNVIFTDIKYKYTIVYYQYNSIINTNGTCCMKYATQIAYESYTD